MTRDADNPLGRTVATPATFDPGVLYQIPRAGGRAQLGIGPTLPFQGEDRWLGWELSWLDAAGVPQIAILELRVRSDSPAMVESKSLKLYLQSMNQTRMGSRADVEARIAADVTAIVGAAVTVTVHDVEHPALQRIAAWPGICIDAAPGAAVAGAPDAAILAASAATVTETVYSHRFRSICPVTGQPDWATVTIGYRGRSLDHGALLAYLLAFRDHPAYHEQCVERIWCDINARFAPAQLDVSANFLRRGGIDINPRRYSGNGLLADVLSLRQ